MTSLSTPPREQSNIELWVLSAGFGFIHESTPLPTYTATFVRGNPDSVIHSKDSTSTTSDWWKLLTDWKSKESTTPASITHLAKKAPTSPIIAAISPNYLRAVEQDLCEAKNVLADPNLLIIISAGTKSHPLLQKNLIPADARLQHLVGGARASLNARIAQWIIANTKHDQLRADKLSRKLSRILLKQPSIPIIQRKIMSDKEVKTFILKKLKLHDKPSHSRFLRILRNEGYACEQKRFREIYQNTAERLDL